MNSILHQLYCYGIVPIISISDPGVVRPVAGALLKAGLPVLEVTFRTDAAAEAIRIASEEFPDMLIGAGTVLTIENARRAVSAGAEFILSPGFNPRVVDYCRENDVTVLPGINSPTQIELALEKGLHVLKFFPAEASGGLSLINAMAGPFPSVRFVPTGGINNSNLPLYMSSPKVYACGGSWVARSSDIAAGRYDQITRNALEAIRTMLGFRIKAVDLPGIPEKDAAAIDSLLSGFFQQPAGKTEDGPRFADILGFTGNQDSPGTICLETINTDRAVFYIRRRGFTVEEDEKSAGGNEFLISRHFGNYRIKITGKSV
jgi:2-dehydro-3-deoxyphosphogluconate aldolase / (4S)-4-hydroxy-2-oxoglutarate aldolase